jgi:hypothetical protein
MTIVRPTIAEIRDLYEKSRLRGENLLAWNKACSAFMSSATSPDELEQLLKYSAIFGGVAAGTIHADCFNECQERLMTIQSERISGCTRIAEIQDVMKKLRKIREAEIHITPGGKVQDAIRRACQKWYMLCTTKEEMVEMIRTTRVDIRDFI